MLCFAKKKHLGDVADCERGLHLPVWAEQSMSNDSNSLARSDCTRLQDCRLQLKISRRCLHTQDCQIQSMSERVHNLGYVPAVAAEPNFDQGKGNMFLVNLAVDT